MNFDLKQREFAAYIRDPQHNPVPANVQPQRMAMYRELFFNNIDTFLSSNFPVLRKLLNDQQWFALAQDFFANHVCQTPYFSEIPEEFLAYLQNERQNATDFPFMLELAHYEWVEMALAIAKEQPIINTIGLESPQQRLQLSPLAWSLMYLYPVHKIAPDFLPSAPPEQPTFLIVYRDVDDEVHFLETSALTYHVLERIEEQDGITAESCLQQALATLPQPSEALFASGWQLLMELVAKNIIVTF